MGPRFQLRVLARAGSSTLNVSGRSEIDPHSSPRPPSLGGGTGAICGVAGGWGGTACIGSSTDSEGGTLRCPAGANCGLAACGSGLTRADGSLACDGSVVRWPKFGFCALQSATSRPSICGRGLLDRRGRANPRIIGVMPAPPCTNLACSHATAQARWRGEVRCSAHY
jgi:hypothetical protein